MSSDALETSMPMCWIDFEFIGSVDSIGRNVLAFFISYLCANSSVPEFSCNYSKKARKAEGELADPRTHPYEWFKMR